MANHRRLLFSAPYSFLGDLIPKAEKDLADHIDEIVLSEAWFVDDLIPDDSIRVWICNPGARFVIDASVLAMFPNLEAVITPSTGTNHINTELLKQNGIACFGLLDERPTLDTIRASAEFTFWHLLSALRRPQLALSEVSSGRWREKEAEMRGGELIGRSVGILGLGRIGGNMARWCRAFDAHVFYCDPYVENVDYPKLSMETLFAECEIVCICCTLTEETKGMIDFRLLSSLKVNAILINTARGEIIADGALEEIIDKRPDLRFGVDVLRGEVTNTHLESPIIQHHKNGRIIVTPHIAGATIESQSKAAKAAFILAKAHFRGW